MGEKLPWWFGAIWLAGGGLGALQIFADPDAFAIKGASIYFLGLSIFGAIIVWRDLRRAVVQRDANKQPVDNGVDEFPSVATESPYQKTVHKFVPAVFVAWLLTWTIATTVMKGLIPYFLVIWVFFFVLVGLVLLYLESKRLNPEKPLNDFIQITGCAAVVGSVCLLPLFGWNTEKTVLAATMIVIGGTTIIVIAKRIAKWPRWSHNK